MMWGGELVLRDGVPSGQVTSAAWGEAVGGVGRPGLHPPPRRRRVTADLRQGSYQVNVGGELCPATVYLRPPYDPAGAGSGYEPGRLAQDIRLIRTAS